MPPWMVSIRSSLHSLNLLIFAAVLIFIAACSPQKTPAPSAHQKLDEAVQASDREGPSTERPLRSIEAAEKITLDNLQNADTTGFKRTTTHDAGAQGGPVVEVDMSQGAMRNTGNPLDVGIQGNGLFRVTDGSRTAYTRNGSFLVNSKNELIVAIGDGCLMSPSILIPDGMTNITISMDGVIAGFKTGPARAIPIGQIKLCQFANPAGLRALAPGLFEETSISGKPVECIPGEQGSGQLLQSFLEASNVDLTKERQRLRYLQDLQSSLLAKD